jgi:hypothetical protein
MPFENLNSNHFSAAEKTATLAALENLENTLSPKYKNLSPDERKKYGSINEQNKLIVNKVLDYRNNAPALSSPDVDWVEFQADYDSRDFIQKTILRLQNILDSLDNNKILHDFDNYQASLTDYGFSQYKAGTKVAGFENKVSDISQFFSRAGTTTSEAPAAPSTTVAPTS